MDIQPISTPDVPSAPIPHKVIDHALLARMVIREGKPFSVSALAAGYSESMANKGLRQAMSRSHQLSELVRQEYERIQSDITKLKPVAVSRLYREIAAPDSPNAMKAIELAGRFKETDWFVRNTDMQLGIFVNLAEQPPQTDKLEEFKE